MCATDLFYVLEFVAGCVGIFVAAIVAHVLLGMIGL